MNIEQVIVQLRLGAPVFAGNVAGAAQYAYGVADQVWLPRPACYVIPESEESEGNNSMTSLQQIIAERVSVIVDLDNSLDRRGQAKAATLHDLRAAVFLAILNWRPDWNPSNPSFNMETRGFRYSGGEILLMDRARLHYSYTFELETTITDLDGWVLPSVPLIEVQGQFVDPITGLPLLPTKSFDVKLT